MSLKLGDTRVYEPQIRARLVHIYVAVAGLTGDATRAPARRTLHPQPSTLHPQPYTLNPQPCTLNPTPSTLNPNPQTPTQAGSFFLSSLLLSSPELSDTQVYEPYIRALFGTASHFCEVVVLKLRTTLADARDGLGLMRFPGGTWYHPPPFDETEGRRTSLSVLSRVAVEASLTAPKSSFFLLYFSRA